MRLTTKILIGAVATAGIVAAGIAADKGIKKLIKTNLSREGIINYKTKVMSEKNSSDFESSPETILGQLFYATVPHSTLTIQNRDGAELGAISYTQETGSSLYAILCHGYHSSAKTLSYLARRYYEAGYNVIIPFMRAHLGSTFEYCTMGWHERLDIADWCYHVDSLDKDAKIVLHGVSMGAATVMMTTGEALPLSVISAIDDCGYTSVYSVYSYKIPKMMKVPAFPTVDIFRAAVKHHVKFDIKQASALNQVRRSHIPTLFIHGGEDNVVPVEMARELYANATCKKDILIFEDADHAMCPVLHPDEYWERIFAFIESNK